MNVRRSLVVGVLTRLSRPPPKGRVPDSRTVPAVWATHPTRSSDIGPDVQKGPEGPFARLHSTDCLQNSSGIRISGDRSPVAPWVWMAALH